MGKVGLAHLGLDNRLGRGGGGGSRRTLELTEFDYIGFSLGDGWLRRVCCVRRRENPEWWAFGVVKRKNTCGDN